MRSPPAAGPRVDRGKSVQRIGVLGGTFDPVHIGHLFVAVEARHQLALDRVLLVPANDPWQKSGVTPITRAADRLAVAAAAAEGVAGVEVSSMEIDRGGPTYTIDTLLELRHQDPQAAIHLIVGADVAAQLHSWHRADELPDLATLVVAQRAGSPAVIDPPGWSVVSLPVPQLQVSSGDLRQRLRCGRPVDFLIPESAIRCIAARGLYAREQLVDSQHERKSAQ